MDYLEIGLNVVKQFIFLVVSLYFIPWLSWVFANEFGKKMPLWLVRMYRIIPSYTIDLFVEIIKCVVEFVTFNIPISTSRNPVHPKDKIHFEIHKDIKSLSLEYGVIPLKDYWWLPTLYIGRYISNAIHILSYYIFAIVSIKWLLPNTFSLILDGLNEWIGFCKGVPNLDYFERMWNAFVEIVWNRFIIGGIKENVLLLLIPIILILLGADTYIKVLDEETGQWRSEILILPFMAIGFVLYNFIHSFIDYESYMIVVEMLNAIGMIVLLVLIIKFIAAFAIFCTKLFVKLILKLCKIT